MLDGQKWARAILYSQAEHQENRFGARLSDFKKLQYEVVSIGPEPRAQIPQPGRRHGRPRRHEQGPGREEIEPGESNQGAQEEHHLTDYDDFHEEEFCSLPADRAGKGLHNTEMRGLA